MKKQYSFKLRYLLSFVAILLVPMLCLFCYMYYSIKSNLYGNTSVSNYANLSQVSSSMDSNIQKLEKIALLARENPNLKPYFLEQSDFNSYLAVSTLRDIASTNDLFSVISVYNIANDLVCSSFGTSPKAYWGSRVLGITLDNGVPVRSFTEDVNEPVYQTGSVHIPNIGVERCLLYFYPISKSGNKPTSVVVMVIRENSLMELFNISADFVGSLMIVDENNTSIASYGATPESGEVWREMSRANPVGNLSELYVREGKSYSVAAVSSLQCRWRYVSIIPLNTVSSQLWADIRWFVVLFFALIIVSGFGIYFALRLNYTPLLKLKQEMAPLAGNSGLNELETIRTAVGVLKTNLDQMTVRVRQTNPTIKNYLLQQLICGGITDGGVLVELESELGMRFGYDSFVVGILDGSAEDSELLADRLALLRLRADTYRVDMGAGGPIHFLFNMNADSFAKNLEKIGSALDSLFAQGNRLRLSAGRPYGLWGVDRSRFEATIAADLRIYGVERAPLYSFADVIEGSVKLSSGFLMEPVREFELAVLRGDVEYIARFPSHVLRELEQNSLPFYYGSHMVYDLAAAMSRCITGAAARRGFMEQLWQMVYNDGAYFAHEHIGQIVTFICNVAVEMINRPEANEGSQINEIMEYIEKTYMQPDFSIQMVAQQFGMSPSWLSHYFKANTRTTVTEYVQAKRMKYAKLLIQHDVSSLQEISQQLGYSNLSSFIRSFKKTEKMTPKQYQDICKKRQRTQEHQE